MVLRYKKKSNHAGYLMIIQIMDVAICPTAASCQEYKVYIDCIFLQNCDSTNSVYIECIYRTFPTSAHWGYVPEPPCWAVPSPPPVS